MSGSSCTCSQLHQAVIEAVTRIGPYIRETPLEHSPYLSRLGGCEAFLKLENIQITGSFKLRGAANKILSLSPAEQQRGVITGSTGNHGAAVAYMLGRLGVPGEIVVPRAASAAKLDLLHEYGAAIHAHGDDCVETEQYARQSAARSGRTFIPPYNDRQVIAGQGTIGHELEHRLGAPDVVLVPVGGGGLIAGVASYLKAASPSTGGPEIIGCQPERSPVMYESVRAGEIVELASQPTLSDGTAGGIEPGSITFGLCRDLVDRFVLVDEDEIRDAIRLVLEKHYLLVEGAAALSVASFVKTVDQYAGKQVVLILSGAKLGLDGLRTVLS
jgi:threonine dehydratase